MKAEFLKNHSYFLEVFNGIEHLFKTESEYPYFKNLWNKTDNFKLEELFGFKRFLAASLVLLCIQKKIVIYREVKDFLGFLANQNNLPVEIIDIYVDFYLKNEILFRVRKVTRYESLEDDELTFFISSEMKENFFREMREMPHRYEEGFFLVNRWFVKNFFEFKKLLKKSKEMIDKNDSFSKSLKLNGYLKIKIPKKAFSLFAIYVKYLIKLDIKDDTVENLYDLMCRTVQLALITAVNYQLNNNYGVYPSLHRNLLIKYKEAYGDNEDNLIELKISINNNLGDYLYRYLEYLLNSNGPYTSLVLTCDTPDFSKFWLKEKYFGDFFFKEFLTTGLKILAENVEKALMEKEKSIQISDVVLPSMFLN